MTKRTAYEVRIMIFRRENNVRTVFDFNDALHPDNIYAHKIFPLYRRNRKSVNRINPLRPHQVQCMVEKKMQRLWKTSTKNKVKTSMERCIDVGRDEKESGP